MNSTPDQKLQMKQHPEEEEMEIDLLELFSYFWTKLGIIILCFVIGGLIMGNIAYFLITPKYQATSKLYMVSASNDSVINLSDLNLGTSMSSDYAELLVTRPVILSVIRELNLGDQYEYEDLVEMLDIATIGNTRILAITVTSTDPQESMEIANCLAQKGTKYLPAVMETSKPNIAEEAIVPKEKSSPSIKLWGIGGAFGLALFCMLILTIRYLRDDTLKNAEDVEKFLGVMPLSVVPEGSMDKTEQKKKEKNREGRKSRT